MKQTEHYGLNLPESGDRVSLEALNQNTQAIDALLAIRPRMASGSYEGQTACAAKKTYTVYSSSSGSSKTVSPNFGDPVNSANDVVITLDFAPQVLFLYASREADFSWSGYLKQDQYWSSDGEYHATYNAFTYNGTEHQAYQQLILAGQAVSSAGFLFRAPAIDDTSASGAYDYQETAWRTSTPETYSGVNGMTGYVGSGVTPQLCQLPTVVEFGTTEDGKHTVTIKGKDSGLNNYADVAGMTYHWIAFGHATDE